MSPITPISIEPKLPTKLTFNEIVVSAMIFLYDVDVEKKFNAQIEDKANHIREANIGHGKPTAEDVLDFILNENDALSRILGIIRIPREKFLRIVALVRELDLTPMQIADLRINESEWNLDKIENKVKENSGHNPFAETIVGLFLNGYKNAKLAKFLPQIYRERFKLETLNEYTSDQNLIFNLKDRDSAAYNSLKGYAIETRIKEQVKLAGYGFAQGDCAFIDRKVDLMVPDAIDPRIIIMSSYDETTSSAQSTRASDMIKLYEVLRHKEMQSQTKHYFVNVVDGGGWLARRNDFKRMWKACDFCLNINTLHQLRAIVKAVM